MTGSDKTQREEGFERELESTREKEIERDKDIERLREHKSERATTHLNPKTIF